MTTTEQHQVLKYHSSIKPLLKYWAAGNTLILILTVVFYKPDTFEHLILVMVTLNLLLLLARSMSTLLKAISIDEKEQMIEIELNRFIFMNTRVKCRAEDVSLHVLSQYSVLTGIIAIFKISHQGKVLIETVAGFSGWTAATLQEIAGRIEMLEKGEPLSVS